MRKCAEHKPVSRSDGTTITRCARYEDTSAEPTDVLVPTSDGDALGRRGRKHGFGLVLPEPIRGLANIELDDVIGPAWGMGGSILGILIAKKFGGRIHSIIPKYSYLAGGILGALLSIPLYWVKGKKSMTSAAVAALTMGVGLTVVGVLESKGLLSGRRRRGTRGMGLLATERMGQLPAPAETTDVPGLVSYRTDVSAYGNVS